MSQEAPEVPPGGFVIETDAPPRVAKRLKRKKTPFWRSPLMIVFLVLAAAGGGVFWKWQQQQAASGLTLKAIPPATIDELAAFSLPVPFSDPSADPSTVLLEVQNGPPGAVIDPATATLQWTPTEEQGPGKYSFLLTAKSKIDPSNVSQVPVELTVNEVNTPVQLEYIEPQNVELETTLTLPLNVEDPDLPRQDYRFELGETTQPNVKLDEQTGVFEWYAVNVDADKAYEFEVRVSEKDFPDVVASRKFQVTVRRSDPVAKLKTFFENREIKVEETGRELKSPYKGKGRRILAGEDRLDVFTYGNKKSADEDAEFIEPDLSKYFGKTEKWNLPTKIYRDDRMFVVASGVSPKMHSQLSFLYGTAIASTGDFSETIAAADAPSGFSNTTGTDADDRKVETNLDPIGDKKLVELYTEKDIFSKNKYEEIRAIVANRFVLEYGDVISAAFGTDEDDLKKWLDEHVEIKEELYTAFDPETDNMLEGLKVFRDLWKKFPDQIEKYSDLAIASAVVWDEPRAGVYDYSRHQRRTHSEMPQEVEQTDVFANFEYLVGSEKIMEGRAQLVPWEFLVHLVNHKTPVAERGWAVQNYLPKRVLFGEAYHDVPYDMLMLETESQQCKLQGQEYTLPNLRSAGGVCAMQADFAARVGKSMGVPAEYVRGDVATGGAGHAWVMWIELKNLTRTGINFSLESHGRFDGYEDLKMYVGELQDPQSGKWITDRQLELRLHTVGLNPEAKRQADYVMAAYPMIRNERKLSVDEQVDYLERVIKLSPGNEAAWTALAGISAEGNLTKKHERLMKRTILPSLFNTFANFPDFTWTIFDNLIQYEEDIEEQIELYQQLLGVYVSAGRPDLACEARLMLTGYLIDADEKLDAVEGLAATIMAFPDEGRYVPKMLDRLEVLCVDNTQFQKHLISFYKAFLPKVPQTRAGSPTQYCIDMYERAIQRFEQAGEKQAAAQYKGALSRLKP